MKHASRTGILTLFLLSFVAMVACLASPSIWNAWSAELGPSTVTPTAEETPYEYIGIDLQCRAALETLCEGVAPGGGRLKKCYYDNESKLTPSCRQQVQERKAEAASILATPRMKEGKKEAEGMEPASLWTLNGSVGFLGNTVDGTAFAFNLGADRFLTPVFSVGPLLQLATTSALFQTALTLQVKYWITAPDTGSRFKINVQGGIGFVHADFLEDDTSWLIPIGVGLDYALSRTLGLTTTFLLNFTNLNTGGGTDAHVMPGLTFGLRF